MEGRLKTCADCYWWDDGCIMTFDWANPQPKADDPACVEFNRRECDPRIEFIPERITGKEVLS